MIKPKFPDIGEVITDPNSCKVSISSFLGAFPKKAYGKKLQESTRCPKERYLFLSK